MADLISTSSDRLDKPQLSEELTSAAKKLTNLIDETAYVGEVYSLGHEAQLTQINAGDGGAGQDGNLGSVKDGAIAARGQKQVGILHPSPGSLLLPGRTAPGRYSPGR